MGVIREEKEYVSATLTPERLFRALVLDGYNLIPKVAPNAVKSTEIVEGDGGAGTIKKITLEGSNYAKQKTEAVDKDNLAVSFSLIEGDGLSDMLEKITYHNKFVAAPGGGTIIKSVREYYTKGDVGDGITNEAKVMERKDRNFQTFKLVEKYLIENPDAYN